MIEDGIENPVSVKELHAEICMDYANHIKSTDLLVDRYMSLQQSGLANVVMPNIALTLDIMAEISMDILDEMDFLENELDKEVAALSHSAILDLKMEDLISKCGHEGPKCIDIKNTIRLSIDYVSDLVVKIRRKYPNTHISIEGIPLHDV